MDSSTSVIWEGKSLSLSLFFQETRVILTPEQ